MSDIIQLLPDHLANQIAAGEVIQRPASAVKELIENAVDAGATSIHLILKDAGKELIQVVDNGKGMSAMDARMSFERHATSKIKKIEDLFETRTKGFRGEALASIAGVAQDPAGGRPFRHADRDRLFCGHQPGAGSLCRRHQYLCQEFIFQRSGTQAFPQVQYHRVEACAG